MDESPFAFAWPVDQSGYEICQKHDDQETAQLLGKEKVEFVVPRGGPLRFYRPLDDDSLWLRFAQNCRDNDGFILFAKEFGRLGHSQEGLDDRLDHILETAALLRKIWEHLQAGNRYSATLLFTKSGLPTMKEAILWYADAPERFHYRLIPLTLRDALLHQAGEAITGNRRFRRCRNEECPNWFRLGPHAAGEAGPGQTITARREFCSDRCRVASARRQKREASAHA
jgi:hypothetical protein